MAGLKLYLCSSRALLVLCFLLLCVHVHHATAISFNYNSFSSDDFREEDDARITDGRIELLGDEAGGRARGRVLYKQPVQLWDGFTGEAASFTASFNFSIQSLNGRSSTPGHGMTFFTSSSRRTCPKCRRSPTTAALGSSTRNMLRKTVRRLSRPTLPAAPASSP